VTRPLRYNLPCQRDLVCYLTDGHTGDHAYAGKVPAPAANLNREPAEPPEAQSGRAVRHQNWCPTCGRTDVHEERPPSASEGMARGPAVTAVTRVGAPEPRDTRPQPTAEAVGAAPASYRHALTNDCIGGGCDECEFEAPEGTDP
jgi:hypothetical protein